MRTRTFVNSCACSCGVSERFLSATPTHFLSPYLVLLHVSGWVDRRGSRKAPVFVCERGCGFEGSFDVVEEHEKICAFVQGNRYLQHVTPVFNVILVGAENNSSSCTRPFIFFFRPPPTHFPFSSSASASIS